MEINLREDSVTIEGYVNAVERNSKPIYSRAGRFIERICKGAFKKALGRNDNVVALLNHDKKRILGSQADETLDLEEDNIGLKAKLTTSDPQVMEDARNGDLVGWSFGFTDAPNGVERGTEEGLPLRKVKDLNLTEVSLLNRQRTPAYDGTLVYVRAEEDADEYYGEDSDGSCVVVEERSEQSEETEIKGIDYSVYEDLINKLKED